MLRVTIDLHGVQVVTDDAGATRVPTRIDHEQRVDEDLHVLGYLHDCLTDGGRLAERRHALHGRPAAPWLKTFGRRLWKRFPEEIQDWLKPTADGRKRICLEIAVDASSPIGQVLHRAPWDLAFYPAVDPLPLGTSGRYALSRLIDVRPEVSVDFPPIGRKLRVLVIRSRHNPVDEHEVIVRRIQEHASIDFNEWTPQKVRDCIERGGVRRLLAEECFDIIQFVAHGTEEQHGRWALDLADDIILTPNDLKLFTTGRCRVVVLAACSSGEAAREILAGGPLGIVAMLYHIGTGTLRRFNELLYENLLERQQPLDVAVQTARQVLATTYTPDCAAPQLYVRETDPIELTLDPAHDQPTSERPSAPLEPERKTGTDDRVVAVRAPMPAPPVDTETESITTTLLGWRVKRDG